MKKIGILIVLIFAVFAVASADKETLIDFTILTGDTDVGDRQENGATLIGFADKAGASIPADERQNMVISLAIENWKVTLASSSRTVDNMRLSKVITAPVSDTAAKYPSDNVMGIRIHFPDQPYNSWAIIEPPFEIPAYEQKSTWDGTQLTVDETDTLRTQFDGYGVLKNVGTIKSISVNIYGSNYPNGFGILLKDQENNVQNIFIGYLEFDGWKTITWSNPNYIEEVRNRELKQYPLYPKSTPMIKFAGIIFYKDAAQNGGDFITYVRDIEMIYDKAVLNPVRDINEEALWGILNEREQKRREAEFSKLGNLQVLRYLESQKMATEAPTTEE